MWHNSFLAIVVVGLIAHSSLRSGSIRPSEHNSDIQMSDSEPEAHQGQPCGECHQLVADYGTTDSWQINFSDQCLTCHTTFGAKSSPLSDVFHRQLDQPCTQCHSFHRTSQLTASGRDFSFDADERARFICESCHRESGLLENLSLGHLGAAEWYHSESAALGRVSPSSTCLGCHSDDHRLQSSPADYTKAIPINMSASHPVGIPINLSGGRTDGYALDARIPLLNGTMECQSCHSLTSGTDFSLVEFSSPYDLCLGCHDQSDKVPSRPMMAEQ